MSATYQDYYAILGVPRTATSEEIQKAYRALARKYHPDVNKEPGADAKFKQLGEANDVLKDPAKRKLYDQLGPNWKAGQEAAQHPGSGQRARAPRGRARARAAQSQDFSGFGGMGGMGGDAQGYSEFFDAIFGQAGQRAGHQPGEDADPFAAGYRAAASAPPKGSDIDASITLPLIDAHLGTTRRLTLRGVKPGGAAAERSIDLKIPAGTTDGSTLRLSAQGEDGPGGRGDLLVKVQITPDPRFSFLPTESGGAGGHDLLTIVPITPWEAALGAKVDVPTLTGTLTISVPPGTSTGQRLRLRGQGFAKRTASTATSPAAGDLHAELRIVLPKTMSDEERGLMEQLAKVSTFKPRG